MRLKAIMIIFLLMISVNRTRSFIENMIRQLNCGPDERIQLCPGGYKCPIDAMGLPRFTCVRHVRNYKFCLSSLECQSYLCPLFFCIPTVHTGRDDWRFPNITIFPKSKPGENVIETKETKTTRSIFKFEIIPKND